MTHVYTYNQFQNKLRSRNLFKKTEGSESGQAARMKEEQARVLADAHKAAEHFGKPVAEVTAQDSSRAKAAMLDAEAETIRARAKIEAMSPQERAQAEIEAMSPEKRAQNQNWIASQKGIKQGDQVKNSRDLYSGATTAEMSPEGKRKAKEEIRSKTFFGRALNKVSSWFRK